MRRDIKAPQNIKDMREARTDTYFKQLLDLTPAQAETWVINNIDTLPKARLLLAKIVKYVVASEKRG